MSSQAVPNPSERRVPGFTSTAVVTMQTVMPPTGTVSLHIKLDVWMSVTAYTCFGWVSLVCCIAGHFRRLLAFAAPKNATPQILQRKLLRIATKPRNIAKVFSFKVSHYMVLLKLTEKHQPSLIVYPDRHETA